MNPVLLCPLKMPGKSLTPICLSILLCALLRTDDEWMLVNTVCRILGIPNKKETSHAC
jgi:hypothetical protein